MIEFLKYIDAKWLLEINSHHTPFRDELMWWLSDTWIWIPWYIFLIVLLFQKYKKQAFLLIGLVLLLILCSDQLASGIIKPLVHRLRPSHNPEIEHLLHYVNNYRGGKYGFVSSHAMNVFSLSFYLAFTVGDRLKWLIAILFIWAFSVAFSRIYLCVHYPSDVIVPFFISAVLGFAFSRLFFYLNNKFNKTLSYE